MEPLKYKSLGCQPKKKCKVQNGDIQCKKSTCISCCAGKLCNTVPFEPKLNGQLGEVTGEKMCVMINNQCRRRMVQQCLPEGSYCQGLSNGIYHQQITNENMLIGCDTCGEIAAEKTYPNGTVIAQSFSWSRYQYKSSKGSGSSKSSKSSKYKYRYKSSATRSYEEPDVLFLGVCFEWSVWSAGCSVLDCTRRRYRKCPIACVSEHGDSEDDDGSKSKRKYKGGSSSNSGSGSSKRRRKRSGSSSGKSSENSGSDSSVKSQESYSSMYSSGARSSDEDSDCFHTESQEQLCSPDICQAPVCQPWSEWGSCNNIDCKQRRIRYCPKRCDNPIQKGSPESSPESDFTPDDNSHSKKSGSASKSDKTSASGGSKSSSHKSGSSGSSKF
ncbi:unnamed protein product [Owenia fusiformis]|uniref:Uncharacterized protein n=1 Tax=Owenia fusiformis TaxID=6347 RepID=A0A8S4NRU4_OWEFU|nr:unnamed protein product [Owenia fusiformis]